MAYIGNQPTSAAFVTDLFSGNGSTVAFTMTVAPANTASILVAISGVVQSPDTYSISGTTLTFSAAPPTGTGNISVRYLGVPATNVTTTAYRTVTEFTATANQTTFSVPSYTVGYIDVYRNGVRLGSADYTASNGTTVVLANAATLGDLVTTESFYVSSVLNAISATGGAINTLYLDAGNANGTGALLTPSGTTAQRPASPIVGMQRWNTTIGGMEVYIGNNNWQTIASTAYSVEYLIAAGGGGGGGFNSGAGGGSGGLLTGSGLSVTPGTSYPVTIGAGGSNTPTNGANSSFGVQTAIGGGLGASNSIGPTTAGSGGSGGGANYLGSGAGLGTAGQGFAGGTGTSSSNFPGNGGGGAGAVGGNTSGSVAGAGGVGAISTISGSSVYYAGGGGGSTQNGGTGGAGGLGGGGAGSPASGSNTGASGTANTGGGGGGGGNGVAGNSTPAPGGSGGSGIVIIRYLGTVQRATGGTVTITGGYVIHTFTSSGSFTA
jgi:hypothetical protein